MIIGGWHYMLSSFHLPGTLLLSAYGTLTTGYTPNVYKFYYNNRYIMVIGTATNPSGGIISFGGGTGSNMQD